MSDKEETLPPPEVVEYASALVWKDASFDVMHKEYEDQYPDWMRLVVGRLRLLHGRDELLLPDLRAFGNRTVALFSDYGGEHKESKFHTYSFLITGLELAGHFQGSMAEIRRRHGLETTEIAFKRFREGRMRAALPDYLRALNNLLPGLLFTLVVDKRIKSLFGAESRQDREFVRRLLEDAGLGRRKPDVNEKAMRVVHLAALLAGLLAHDGQKIFWMTDNDAISEGEQGALDTLRMFARALGIYTREGVSVETVEGATAFEDRHTDTLDLLSACDIVAGAVSDYMSKLEDMAEADITVKEGSDRVLQWMPVDGVGLRKVVLVARPDRGGICVGTLQIRTEVPKEKREILIGMSPRP